MEALNVAGLVLTLLLLSVMLGKRNKFTADYFLILYLFVSALGHGYFILEQTDWMQHSYWMLLGRGLYLVYSPLFFLYIYALTHQGAVPRWLYAILLTPVIAYVFHFFYFYLWVFDTNSIDARTGLLYVNGVLSWSWLIFVILILIIEPVYLLWFYIVLRDYRNRMMASVSNMDKIHLKWVVVLFYLRVAMAVLLVPASLLAVGQNVVSMEFLQIAIELTSLVFFFVLGYYGFNQTTVFTNVEFNVADSPQSIPYERSGLTEEQARRYHDQLLGIMKEKKPYLDGELGARDLAVLAGISTNHLSEVLNRIQHQNFFDFVNSFRVDEVKQRLKDPKNSHLTLLAIALDAGFNSKTSFNTTFKKFTGQTPSQFVKSVEPPH